MNHILSLVNVTCKIGDYAVLNNINLNIPKNQIIYMIGLSGSGKTTLIYSIIGALPIQRGKIYKYTQDITAHDIYRRNIRYVENNITSFDELSLYENIRFGIRDDSKITDHHKAIVKVVKIVELENKLHIKAKVLSDGQKQRMAIARALIDRSDLIILDEPFNKVDPVTKKHLIKLVAKIAQVYEVSFIITSHSIDETVSHCNSLIFVDQKTATLYPKESLMSQPPNISIAHLMNKYNIFEVLKITQDNNNNVIIQYTSNRTMILSLSNIGKVFLSDKKNAIVCSQNIEYIDQIDIDEFQKKYIGYIVATTNLINYFEYNLYVPELDINLTVTSLKQYPIKGAMFIFLKILLLAGHAL